MQRQSEVANGDEDGGDGGYFDGDDDGDDGEGDFQQYSVFRLSQDSSTGRILYIFPKRYCPWRKFPKFLYCSWILLYEI